MHGNALLETAFQLTTQTPALLATPTFQNSDQSSDVLLQHLSGLCQQYQAKSPCASLLRSSAHTFRVTQSKSAPYVTVNFVTYSATPYALAP